MIPADVSHSLNRIPGVACWEARALSANPVRTAITMDTAAINQLVQTTIQLRRHDLRAFRRYVSYKLKVSQPVGLR
jgi:hypothetical protein